MNSLQPQEVFSIFHEITRIPRPSKHEELISRWLMDYAANHHIEAVQDEAMNVIMRVPATPGYEDHEGVILQAHMDMVCEKDGHINHDFMVDPIDTYIDGEWLKARGTTLGGDDGIGMAMALAALTSKTLQHPAMEALFTVDEETGLTGAFKLKEGMLHGKRLINLDSEDDGQIFIGCAGGIDTLAKMHYEPVSVDQLGAPDNGGKWFPVKMSVSGLMGGHSGDDINKGRANAVKIMANFLYQVQQATPMQLAIIEGGNLRNAIAREATATFCVPMVYKEQLRVQFNIYTADMEKQFGTVEKDMHLSLESTDMPEQFIPTQKAHNLLIALYACPHGMIAMSKEMPGLVETSTNLASVKMKEGYIEVNTSQRSSVESEKHHIKNRVEIALGMGCDEVTHGDGYPGWKPNPHSPLVETTRHAYKDLFGEEPQVLAIHAGLECGLFLEKYPYLDMVSIGPQMYGVHSPQERLSIPSTGRCWQWLTRVIETL